MWSFSAHHLYSTFLTILGISSQVSLLIVRLGVWIDQGGVFSVSFSELLCGKPGRAVLGCVGFQQVTFSCSKIWSRIMLLIWLYYFTWLHCFHLFFPSLKVLINRSYSPYVLILLETALFKTFVGVCLPICVHTTCILCLCGPQEGTGVTQMFVSYSVGAVN